MRWGVTWVVGTEVAKISVARHGLKTGFIRVMQGARFKESQSQE